MKQIGVAELKDNLSKYLRAAEAGEAVEVTDRNRPMVRIVPITGATGTRIIPPRKPFASVRRRPRPPRNWAIDSLTLLLEERQGR